MSKHWQKEKKTIYYLAKLLSKFFSQCICSRKPTLSLLKNIFVTYFSQDCKLALLQHFLRIFITNCSPRSGFVNWTAVIHYMKPKCEQHAKENRTKMKLNHLWHLFFQKQGFVCRNFYGLGFFSFFTFKSAKIDVRKKTAESKPLVIT